MAIYKAIGRKANNDANLQWHALKNAYPCGIPACRCTGEGQVFKPLNQSFDYQLTPHVL